MSRKSYTVNEIVAFVEEYNAIKPQPSQRYFAESKSLPITSFCTWVRHYHAGRYSLARSGSHKKIRSHKYAKISMKFRKFLQFLINSKGIVHNQVSYSWLSDIACMIAQKYLTEEERMEFYGSTKWIRNEIKFCGFTSFKITDGVGLVSNVDISLEHALQRQLFVPNSSLLFHLQ